MKGRTKADLAAVAKKTGVYKKGGSVTPEMTGGNKDVIAEAKKGSIGKIGGKKVAPRADRKQGGACSALSSGFSGSPYSSARGLRRSGGEC